MYKHPFEERLNIVSHLVAGEPITFLCKELHLDEHDVRMWYLRYKKYGENGLRGTRSFHYSAEEKLSIVKEVVEKGVTLSEVSLLYNLHRSTVKLWCRKFRLGKSLENSKRGRPPLKTLWQDRRRKKHRQSLKSLRKRTSACELRMHC